MDRIRLHSKTLESFLKKHESKIKDLRFMAHLFRKSLLSMIGLVLILILVAPFAGTIYLRDNIADIQGFKPIVILGFFIVLLGLSPTRRD